MPESFVMAENDQLLNSARLRIESGAQTDPVQITEIPIDQPQPECFRFINRCIFMIINFVLTSGSLFWTILKFTGELGKENNASSNENDPNKTTADWQIIMTVIIRTDSLFIDDSQGP